MYKQDETAEFEADFKKAQIFSDEQEQLFVDYLINTSDMFYMLTIDNFRHTKHMEGASRRSLGPQAQHTHFMEDHTWSIQ